MIINESDIPPQLAARRGRTFEQSMRRLLRAKEAAAYLGYSSNDILAFVPVEPVYLRTGGSPRWDMRALDQFLDRISGLADRARAGEEGARAEADAALAAWRIGRAAQEN